MNQRIVTPPRRVVRIGVTRWDAERTLANDRDRAAALDLDYSFVSCTNADQVVDAVRDAQIVLTPEQPVPRRAIESMLDGRLIVCTSVGFDLVDIAAAAEHGVVVATLPLFCVDDVADHTLALLLACVRQVSRQDAALKAGQWSLEHILPMPGLRGKVLGLLGAGNIGRRVASRARAFGLDVFAYDPNVNEAAGREFGIKMVSLEQLLANADFVSCHTPLTDETRHMLGESQFRSMKPSAYFVNTSRGSVIDEAWLIRALQEKWIAGAGLDVFENEPLGLDNPLLGMSNTVLTPHTAYHSETSAENLRTMAWDLVERFVGGKWPTSVVNPDVRERVDLGA